MKHIAMTAEKIEENIHEAKELIRKAYELREIDETLANWYRDMASEHLGFNDAGHSAVTKIIHDWKSSGKQSELAPGMMAVYNDIHAKLIRETAEVKSMIDMFK